MRTRRTHSKELKKKAAQTRRTYSKELKQKAVQYAKETSCSKAARKYTVCGRLVAKWVKQAESGVTRALACALHLFY